MNVWTTFFVDHLLTLQRMPYSMTGSKMVYKTHMVEQDWIRLLKSSSQIANII